MKRDPDLIRRIVLAIQDQPARDGRRFISHELLADVDQHELREHIRLADEACLTEINVSDHLGGGWAIVAARLTNLGHDFAEELSTDEQLNRAAEWIKEAGRQVTMTLLIEWARRQIGA